MARPLHEIHEVDEAVEAVERAESESWVTRSTARAFAAALSALLVASLVVNRSGEALTTEGTIAGTAVGSGTVSLIDDDEGQALFDLQDMAPGRPVIRCIEVVYEGTILPVDLAVRAEAAGALAGYLDVTIVEGTGGGFETCEGFAATSSVFAGTLAQLHDAGWQPLGPMVNTGDRRTYRITFDVQDRQEALGLATNADFTWEATPS
jgi:hypothetical protein